MSGQMLRYNSIGFLCVMLLILQKTNAREFQLGGNGQWSAGSGNLSANFNQWAEKMRFQIGDSLGKTVSIHNILFFISFCLCVLCCIVVFNYKADQDSVLQVTREAYSNCTTDAPTAKFTDGHTVFTFNHSGAYYFISGNKDNCLKNQKLVVIVMANRTSSTYSPPPSATAVPAPAPAADYTPPTGTVEYPATPTPAPESTPNAAPSSSFSLLSSIIGAVFAASPILLAL